MDDEFWRERWGNGEINFHRATFHEYLVEHFPQLKIPKGSHIMVPLAGKSRDLLWLSSQGYHVHAIEIVPIAIQQFIEENGFEDVKVTQNKRFKVYQMEGITFYEGDFLKAKAGDFPQLAGHYDRASLIAFPLEMRIPYYKKIAELLPRGAQSLLISFEYDSPEVQGPPFSVSEGEIRMHLKDTFVLRMLNARTLTPTSLKFTKAGSPLITEKAWGLVRN